MAYAVHAVDHVLAGINAPRITASFGAHAGAANQSASVQGALEQSNKGLEQAQEARVALAAAAKEQTNNQNSNLGGIDSARGPSFLGQIGQTIAVGAAAAVSPMAGAVLGAALAIGSIGSNPMGSGAKNVLDTEYGQSSAFKSFDDSLSEVDAFYRAEGDATGQTYQNGFAAQPGVQLHLLETARDTVATLGRKQVLSDLGAASANEQNLQRQMGATLQFVEKNGMNPSLNQGTINNSVANGWTPPTPGMGM